MSITENLAQAQALAYAWDIVHKCIHKDEENGECKIMRNHEPCTEYGCPFTKVGREPSNA
jgi:hypothetical protein